MQQNERKRTLGCLIVSNQICYSKGLHKCPPKKSLYKRKTNILLYTTLDYKYGIVIDICPHILIKWL